MKKRVTGSAILIVAILLAGASSAEAGEGKTYWLGKGEDRNSRIEFVVNKGTVSSLLTITGQVRCSDGRRSSLGKSWDDFALSGNSFEQRERSKNGAFFAAGHLRAKSASGRLKSKFTGSDSQCESDFVQWTAKQVTREEWREARQP